MSIAITLIAIVTVAAAAISIGVLFRAWYRPMLEERLSEEAAAHLPIRRRIRRHVRSGPRTATERVQVGRAGWWWLWADVREEAMGVAWTRRGARRQLEAYLRHRAGAASAPRHVVVKRAKRPRRRPVPMPIGAVQRDPAT